MEPLIPKVMMLKAYQAQIVLNVENVMLILRTGVHCTALTCTFEENGCTFLHQMSPLCRFNATCANKLCQFRHSSKSKNINTREVEKDKHTDNGDNSDEVNIEEINDSELEDDDDEETEIIYQRFLENHKKKENENRKKSNEENVTAQMQKFKFVST